jgi:hypothetical protein
MFNLYGDAFVDNVQQRKPPGKWFSGVYLRDNGAPSESNGSQHLCWS